MILGPDDPRAITGKDREAAIANTEKWNEFLGIKPLTPRQRARKEKLLNKVLTDIGHPDAKPEPEDQS